LTLPVMTYNARSGMFASTNFLNGLSCQVNYLSNTITLDNLQPRLGIGMIITIY